MEIIGVIDLRHGRAVHAVAGVRDRYLPVQNVAGVPINGNAAELARVYVGRLGIRELYVADLDAILDGRLQHEALHDVASCGAPVWLDAGVRSVDAARDAVLPGISQIVVGLETLPSWSALATIVDAIGSAHVAFSLDLRNGSPVRAAQTDIADETPERLAARAFELGIETMIVLDLARVGTSTGLDVDLIGRVREAVPDARLAAGGGVRGQDDLDRLAAAGCDAALVATALHDGTMGRVGNC